MITDIAVCVLVLISAINAIIQLFTEPQHFKETALTVHAKFHIMVGIFYGWGLSIITILLALGPARHGNVWALAGLATYGVVIGTAIPSSLAYFKDKSVPAYTTYLWLTLGTVYVLCTIILGIKT